MCWLEKTHFEYNDRDRLKLQECKSIIHRNTAVL